ncbi:MAG: High-affinity branched-chain amino acid transport system permease protein LivH [uncultured Solirubrobacteraceae bacterium]|uniref:High-affinity branched-chain amino acid transport system permease protein LivH n=1 Tax=uncultured Solirubrobacteraceae bacterium TaxID=1162706 RepID=A0A6J4SSL8_9ACTN|nr:MAG: High-affinity branched-chain amino acid transport system permease protein LivH [uncultured Solirubrobacteraceae bacterium]
MLNAIVQGILLGGLYALFAAGLSLMFGVMRIVNLAHGDLAIVGAFLAFALVDAVGLPPFVTLLVVVPALAAAGFALQAGVLNHTLRGGELPPILATFGLAVVLQNVMQEAFSADQRGIDAGAIENSSIALGGDVAIGWLPLLTLGIGVAVIVGLWLLLDRTQLGRAFRAASDDPEAAEIVGIDQRKLYAVATAIALATVGVAGVLLSIRTTFGPTDGASQLIFAFEAVIIGGLGNLWGTLVGGIVLGVAQTVGAQVDPAYGVLAGHLVFLGVLVFRPTGLFPRTVPA